MAGETNHPIFIDAVAEVRDWLLDHLEVPVIVKARNDEDHERHLPQTFVRLDLAGGGQLNLVADAPRIVFEAWGPTKAAAHDLLQEVRVLVRLLPNERGPVQRVNEVGGPVDLPDPLSGSERFTCQFVVHTRGEPYELGGS